LVKLAKGIFDEHMPQPNQLYVRREDVHVTGKDLISTSGFEAGSVTDKGLHMNVNVALQYMEAWLRGFGCVPIHNLMEDAATAEISRSQIWQWVRHGAKTKEGRSVTPEYVQSVMSEETAKIKAALGEAKYKASKFDQAQKFLAGTVLGKDYADFLTVCFSHT
jgi:malate synthase